MSILSSFFKGGKNPADAAMPYLNQIPGVGHDYYDSYINQGRGASERVGGEYDKLLSDPTGFIQKLMDSYQTSGQYGYERDKLTNELGNTAAAGGFAGNPYHQQQQGEMVQGLLSKDMQQYLQNALGVYNTGLQGEQGLADTGYDASGKLTDLLGGTLNTQAGLAFQGQSQKNANQSALFKSLMGALSGGGGLGGIGSGIGKVGSLLTGGFGSDMYGGS